jgi:hypothetical protein
VPAQTRRAIVSPRSAGVLACILASRPTGVSVNERSLRLNARNPRRAGTPTLRLRCRVRAYIGGGEVEVAALVVVKFVATGGTSGAAGAASVFVVGFVAGSVTGGGGVAGAGFDDSVS